MAVGGIFFMKNLTMGGMHVGPFIFGAGGIGVSP